MPKYTTIAIALALVILTPHPADAAWCWWKKCKTSKPVAVVTTPAPQGTPLPVSPVTTPAVPPTPTTPPISTETVISAWMTAYTYFDNDPPGTATISDPIIHKVAGGTGTYTDPITLAVGYTSAGPDIAPGTKYYVPAVQRYFIVEDTCAACHKGSQGLLWLDMWIDGSKTTAASADQCANALTAIHNVIKNPKSTYPVTVGPLSGSSCSPLYPETPKI